MHQRQQCLQLSHQPQYQNKPPPTPTTSRYTAIHILAYNNFKLEPQPTELSRPSITVITIIFNLFVVYYGYTPFMYITKILKITTVYLRGLQKGERIDKNAKTLC